jgi:signal transduction histidine kinase
MILGKQATGRRAAWQIPAGVVAAALIAVMVHAVVLAGRVDQTTREAIGGEGSRWVHRFFTEELREHSSPTLVPELSRSGPASGSEGALRRIMRDMGATGLTVHHLDGHVLWSSDPNAASIDPAVVRLGIPSSRVGVPATYDGEELLTTQTLVPMNDVDGTLIAAAAVSYPAGEASAAVGRVRADVWSGAAAGSLLLFMVLALIMAVGRKKELALQQDLYAGEAALSREKVKLETIVEGLGVGLCVVDLERRVLWANQVLTELTGAREGDLWTPGGGDAMTSGTESRGERVLVGSDGTERRLLLVAWPLRDENGETTQALELVQDITERREREGRAANQEKMAALGRVAAGVAHEVGNPLSSISALVQLMQRRGTPGVSSELGTLQEHVGRIGEIVRSVQGFAGPAAKVKSTVDVNVVVRKALSIARLDGRWKKVEVEDELGPEPLTIRGNANQLLQVVLNLLLNAADAVDGVGTVRLKTAAVGTDVIVSVADSGPGLPAEAAPRIFEPFFTTKKPGQGTGLGLHVSWNIVTEHGGTITTSNHRGGGAEFVVRLPVAGAVEAGLRRGA